MTDDGIFPLDRTALALVLVALCLLALGGLLALAVTGDGLSSLLLVVLVIPLLVVLGPLCYIGTKVASRTDDPDEVEARLAKSLGMSRAEFQRRREGKGRYVHPAEREFEEDSEDV